MPVIQQELAYNGHKQCHALKYQFISCPDGLVFCSVLFPGHQHDSHIATNTKLVCWAQWNAKTEAGEQLYLFSNQAYGNSSAIITKFCGNIITSMEANFNYIMSKFRIQVEWAIGHILTQWLHFSVKCWQQTGLTPVGQDWLVGVLLCNAKTCMIGNQVSMRLGCDPPMLKDYFSSPQVRRATVSPNPSISQSGVNMQDITDNEEETLVEHVV